jgi:hypothetical protein
VVSSLRGRSATFSVAWILFMAVPFGGEAFGVSATAGPDRRTAAMIAKRTVSVSNRSLVMRLPPVFVDVDSPDSGKDGVMNRTLGARPVQAGPLER